MGHAEDPKDGNAVATAVFGAVAVYGVCYYLSLPLAMRILFTLYVLKFSR